MQWNTSVRAEPSAVQRSFPTNERACLRAACSQASRRGLTRLSGLALQPWVAEEYEEHLLSRMNAEVTLSEEGIAERQRAIVAREPVCAALVHSERNFTVAVSGAGRRW